LKTGSGKNTKTNFVAKIIKSPDLEIIGQRSSVINKLQKPDEENTLSLNLHNYFGMMEN
jgi:hypothetical protein